MDIIYLLEIVVGRVKGRRRKKEEEDEPCGVELVWGIKFRGSAR